MVFGGVRETEEALQTKRDRWRIESSGGHEKLREFKEPRGFDKGLKLQGFQNERAFESISYKTTPLVSL